MSEFPRVCRPRKVWNEAIATLNELARSQGPPFEVLADRWDRTCATTQGQGQRQGQGKQGQRQRLMEQTTLQHWLRRSIVVDTVRMQRAPSSAPALRGPSRPAQLFFSEPCSRFAVRRWLSCCYWCFETFFNGDTDSSHQQGQQQQQLLDLYRSFNNSINRYCKLHIAIYLFVGLMT